MPSHQFEYLPLVLREHGPARFPQAPQSEDATTASNKANRAGHAGGLAALATSVSSNWQTRQAARLQAGLPQIEVGIPLLLKIDPSLDLDELRKQFHFEIISEYEDGFVIVASEEVDLADFQQKLTDFVLLYGEERSHLHTLQLSQVKNAMIQITATVPTDMDGGQRQFETSAGGTSGSFTAAGPAEKTGQSTSSGTTINAPAVGGNGLGGCNGCGLP